MPACSHANIRPVRPNPVATSSAMKSAAVATREHMQRAKIGRRMRPHAGRTLHQGLDDHRGEAPGVRRERALRLGQCGAERRLRIHAALPAEDVRRRQADRGLDGARDEAMEGVRVADPDRPQRVAVVRLDQRREARAPGVSAQLVVLERDAEGGLDRGRARVGVEHARQARAARPGRVHAPARSAGTLPRPRSVVCATRSSWARSAASRLG